MSARRASLSVLQAEATKSVYELDEAYHKPQDEDWHVVLELLQAYDTDGLVSAEAFSAVQALHRITWDNGELGLFFEVAGRPDDMYNLEEVMAILQGHQHNAAAAAAATTPVVQLTQGDLMAALRELPNQTFTPQDEVPWRKLVALLRSRAVLNDQQLARVTKFRKKNAAKGDGVVLHFTVQGYSRQIHGVTTLVDVLLRDGQAERPAQATTHFPAAGEPQGTPRISSPDELPEAKATRGRSNDDSPCKARTRSAPAAGGGGDDDDAEGDGVARVRRSSNKVESRNRPHKPPSGRHAAAAAGPSGRGLIGGRLAKKLRQEAVDGEATESWPLPVLGLRRRRSSSTAAGSSEGAGAYRQANEEQLQYAAEPATSQPNQYGVKPYAYNGKIDLFRDIDENAGAIKKLGELLEAIAAANEEPPGTWEDLLEQAVDLGVITFGGEFGRRRAAKTAFVNLLVGPTKDKLHVLQKRLWRDWGDRTAAGGPAAPKVGPAAAAEPPAAQQPFSSQAASAAAAGPMPAPAGSRAAAAAAGGGMTGRSAGARHSAQQLPAPQHKVARAYPTAPLAADQETLQLQARLHEQQQQLGEAQRRLAAEQQQARELRDQLASAQQQAQELQDLRAKLAASQKQQAQLQEQLAAEQQQTQSLRTELAAEQQQTGHLQEQLAAARRALTAAVVDAEHHNNMWNHWRQLRLNELPELINLRQQVRELQQQEQGGGRGRGRGRGRGGARGRAGPG